MIEQVLLQAEVKELRAPVDTPLNEWAHNTYTDCRGLFQHLGRYWPGRVQTYARLLDRYEVEVHQRVQPEDENPRRDGDGPRRLGTVDDL